MTYLRTLALAATVTLSTASTLQAATITYVGHQVAIEKDEDDPKVGWRNPKPEKPLDIDGDNILGTDGWAIVNNKSNPDYAWITLLPTGRNNGFGKWDDPSNPSGPDRGGGMLHNPKGDTTEAYRIIISKDDPKGKTIRLGVLYSVNGKGKCTVSLTQTVGGKDVVISPVLSYDGTALDVAFFNITGAHANDTFIVSTRAVEGSEGIGGITFDSAPSSAKTEVAEPVGVVRKTYDVPFEVCGLFADNGVLQRDVPVSIWGWDDPGTTVTVSFGGQTVKSKADERNKWIVTLKPMKASKVPHELVISTASESIKRINILVGDVWLCAGQSNMLLDFTFERMPVTLPDHVKPVECSTIRHFRVPDAGAAFPQPRLPDGGKRAYEWLVCNDKNYKKFTATGLFFAHTVSKEMDIPIGLINVAKGNTRIGSWVTPKGIELVKDHVPSNRFKGVYNGKASALYFGKVSPITDFPIKGMLWYQGEAQKGEGESYFWKMKALICGWREVWKRGDLPFYFAQLPSYTSGSWEKTREAQRKVLTIPNTGMAVLTDAGENQAKFPASLHPSNKYVVGRRLALWALAKDYGKKDLVYSGPLFKSAEFKGDQAVITFDHVGSGLMAAKKESSRSIEPPKPVTDVIGFEIAGPDKKWVAATAIIKGDTIVLKADKVKNPVAARYLYTVNTDHGTLYNKEGLPASPFITTN